MRRSRLAVIALAGLLFTGCGRGYRLVGRVIGLAVGPGRSLIREVTGQPIPSKGQPLAGAVVTLFHSVSKTGEIDRTSTWKHSELTLADGSFKLYDYATPGHKNLVAVEITAPGYKTAILVYWDYMEPDEQAFFAVLRPVA